jgi:hypothetical protein
LEEEEEEAEAERSRGGKFAISQFRKREEEGSIDG